MCMIIYRFLAAPSILLRPVEKNRFMKIEKDTVETIIAPTKVVAYPMASSDTILCRIIRLLIVSSGLIELSELSTKRR